MCTHTFTLTVSGDKDFLKIQIAAMVNKGHRSHHLSETWLKLGKTSKHRSVWTFECHVAKLKSQEFVGKTWQHALKEMQSQDAAGG
jgi:hypothetical protein